MLPITLHCEYNSTFSDLHVSLENSIELYAKPTILTLLRTASYIHIRRTI